MMNEPNQLHKYRVRPGYGSDRLLIEFFPTTADERFCQDLKALFAQHGIKRVRDVNLVLMECGIYDSPVGEFELEDDGWYLFALADDNQPAIEFQDRIMKESGRFLKEEVDFAQYAKIPNRGKI